MALLTCEPWLWTHSHSENGTFTKTTGSQTTGISQVVHDEFLPQPRFSQSFCHCSSPVLSSVEVLTWAKWAKSEQMQHNRNELDLDADATWWKMKKKVSVGKCEVVTSSESSIWVPREDDSRLRRNLPLGASGLDEPELTGCLLLRAGSESWSRFHS